MSNQEITQHRASGLLIAIGIGIALFLVFAVKANDIPARLDLMSSPKAAPVVEDWKGNSGSIPYRSSLQ